MRGALSVFVKLIVVPTGTVMATGRTEALDLDVRDAHGRPELRDDLVAAPTVVADEQHAGRDDERRTGATTRLRDLPSCRDMVVADAATTDRRSTPPCEHAPKPGQEGHRPMHENIGGDVWDASSSRP